METEAKREITRLSLFPRLLGTSLVVEMDHLPDSMLLSDKRSAKIVVRPGVARGGGELLGHEYSSVASL
jgi:hypothetical protein